MKWDKITSLCSSPQQLSTYTLYDCSRNAVVLICELCKCLLLTENEEILSESRDEGYCGLLTKSPLSDNAYCFYPLKGYLGK